MKEIIKKEFKELVEFVEYLKYDPFFYGDIDLNYKTLSDRGNIVITLALEVDHRPVVSQSLTFINKELVNDEELKYLCKEFRKKLYGSIINKQIDIVRHGKK